MAGKRPIGAMTTSTQGFTWAANADSGLIVPNELGIGVPLKIVRIVLSMAGQSTFSVDIVDGTSTINLITGTTATSHHAMDLGMIMPGQALKISTTGAGTTSVKAIVTLADANYMHW